MSANLTALCDLDQTLLSLFEESELNTEEILRLVDNREQLLQNILDEHQKAPEFERSPEWQEAIARTKRIVEQMQTKTGQIGEQLRKYRHGNKSVQRYQQFL